jgi:hypothetical protein
MTENTTPATDHSEAGRLDPDRPGEESTQAPSGTTSEATPDDGNVPDKQVGRWKDDGGAVDFTS